MNDIAVEAAEDIWNGIQIIIQEDDPDTAKRVAAHLFFNEIGSSLMCGGAKPDGRVPELLRALATLFEQIEP